MMRSAPVVAPESARAARRVSWQRVGLASRCAAWHGAAPQYAERAALLLRQDDAEKTTDEQLAPVVRSREHGLPEPVLRFAAQAAPWGRVARFAVQVAPWEAAQAAPWVPVQVAP